MYGPVVDLTFHLIEFDSNTVSLLLVSSYWFYKTAIKQPKLVNDMWLCETLEQNTLQWLYYLLIYSLTITSQLKT